MSRKFALLTCLLTLTTLLAAAQVLTRPEVVNEDQHDTSIPVRFLAAPAPHHNHVVLPLHRRPGAPIVGNVTAQMEQQIAMPEVGTTNLLNFDGVSDVDGVAPPDTNASVGTTQVVETVNTSYQVFDKSTGSSIFGPAEISSVFSGLTGACGNASASFSDPVVLYDKAADRWLVSILASPDGFATGVECVAISTGSDATGAYNRYSFSFGTNQLNDYPKFGVWTDAYYASYNMFSPTAFIGAKVCAYNRTNMLAGKKATAVCFLRTTDFSFLPSDLDGSSIATAGEPNFFLELSNSTTLHLFKFHVNFTTPSMSTFKGPTKLTVNSYTEACAATGTCIPQKGTTQQLDSLGDRLMFRLAYRNFSDHEALVASHSVKGNKTASAVRWYEIRSPNGTPTVSQQGTFSISGLAIWMPSIGMDKTGDIAVGFSESSSTTHPAIAYTGRIPMDPAGTLESAFTVFTGAGSQNGGLSRWGDYSSISIDPTDDCTFWVANEYIPSNGSFNWHTRLASFKFTACN